MDVSFEQLLLDHLGDIRTSQSEIKKEQVEQGSRLTRIETSIKPLFDNGQPGLLTKLADSLDKKVDQGAFDNLKVVVEDLKTTKNRLMGAVLTLSPVCLFLMEEYLRSHFLK